MDESQNTIKPGQTYICLDNENGTKFEVDLITYREKGQQVKYLSVSFTDTNQNIASLSLNQESFDTIKLFFKQLDWNG
jgi:type VI protein secretion system component Hcp